jgi:hypothetical protein
MRLDARFAKRNCNPELFLVWARVIAEPIALPVPLRYQTALHSDWQTVEAQAAEASTSP